MMRSRLMVFGGFFLAALLSSPAWGSIPPQPGTVNQVTPVPPQPGTVNYVEGQAASGGRALSANSVGSVKLGPGQTISTENGRVEILLTPGIFLRVADRSAVQMVSPGLADTIVALQRGRAMVEVDQIRPENNVRISVRGVSTQLLKAGLYDFDADRGLIRVFDGEALVQSPGQNIQLKRGHEISLNAAGKWKSAKFDEKASMDDFYRWSSLRSSYLAEANIDAARSYTGVYGWAPGWYGWGWYWDPWFGAFTFIPGDGIFWGPFGWGFYSPWYAFAAPYFGWGYWGHGFYHHFGPDYHPPAAFHAGRSLASVGHAYSVRGMAGVRSGFGGGGFYGGGFHGGGGGGRGR